MKPRLAAAVLLVLSLPIAGCAARRSPGARDSSPGIPDAGTAATPEGSSAGVPVAGTTGDGPAASTAVAGGFTALAMNARVEAGSRSRKLKLRFFAAAPDRFRMEVRGPVGGIVLVATGREGKVRVVLPSRRRHADGGMEDDLGTGLLGMPLSGCDLAMVMRISSGMKRFTPCAAPGETPPADEASVPADRPGLIVDASASGEELVRFGWDWSGGGPLPREVRVEILGESPLTLALTELRSIDPPRVLSEDFFWEPLPRASQKHSLSALTEDLAL